MRKGVFLFDVIRRACTVLLMSLAFGQVFAASPGSADAQVPASGVVEAERRSASGKFPDLPLKRDSDPATPGMGSAIWAIAVLLAVLAAGGVLLRKGKRPQFNRNWRDFLKPKSSLSAAKVLSKTGLTAQASLHVVEWNGEEMLLGCTQASVAILARRPLTAANGESAQ
ncbi:MAG: hypothetical protein JWQ07_4048 [Ramlibacter sp.]|nr:hypothetical protein [Ramlibacter sp.]